MPDFENKATFPGCRAIKESKSGDALLVAVDGKEVWIPQSQIDDNSEVYEPGTRGELVISQWFAEQKGLV